MLLHGRPRWRIQAITGTRPSCWTWPLSASLCSSYITALTGLAVWATAAIHQHGRRGRQARARFEEDLVKVGGPTTAMWPFLDPAAGICGATKFTAARVAASNETGNLRHVHSAWTELSWTDRLIAMVIRHASWSRPGRSGRQDQPQSCRPSMLARQYLLPRHTGVTADMRRVVAVFFR